MNSFELVFSMIGDDVIIDRDYYTMKEEQCKINIFYDFFDTIRFFSQASF